MWLTNSERLLSENQKLTLNKPKRGFGPTTKRKFMNDQEIIEALSSIAFEMTTLEPRLSEPFSSNVKVCGELARNIRTELESRGKNNDN
jgi:hypothetical protein